MLKQLTPLSILSFPSPPSPPLSISIPPAEFANSERFAYNSPEARTCVGIYCVSTCCHHHHHSYYYSTLLGELYII